MIRTLSNLKILYTDPSWAKLFYIAEQIWNKMEPNSNYQ